MSAYKHSERSKELWVVAAGNPRVGLRFDVAKMRISRMKLIRERILNIRWTSRTASHFWPLNLESPIFGDIILIIGA